VGQWFDGYDVDKGDDMERIKADLILEGVIEATPEEEREAWESALKYGLAAEILATAGAKALEEVERRIKGAA